MNTIEPRKEIVSISIKLLFVAAAFLSSIFLFAAIAHETVVEKEELFDTRQQGELAFSRAAEPKKRVVIPGITHYGIYTVARDQSIGLAIEWMDLHLKSRM